MTKQQQIVNELARILQGVTGIHLATPDQSRAFKPADLPAILILDEDAQEEMTTLDGGKESTLRIRLILIVDSTTISAAGIRELVGLMYSTIGNNSTTLDTLTSYLAPVERAFALTQQGKMVAAATVTLEVVYQSRIWEI